jgi:hypothetical protein
MISDSEVLGWLRKYLAAGGLLSNRLIDRLKGPVKLHLVLTDSSKLTVADLDVGGRGMDRNAVLDIVRSRLMRHFSEPSACALVEDLWAEKQLPCGEKAPPWIVLNRSGHDELYWVFDRRWQTGDPGRILGATTGRRFLVVLSSWPQDPPQLCADLPDGTLNDMARRTKALVTEIFDGESYLVTDFDDLSPG